MRKFMKTTMKLKRLSLPWTVFCSLFIAVNPAFAQGVTFMTRTLPAGRGPTSVAVADINGDGKVDLICANDLTNTLTVLTNNGSGSFGSNATLAVENNTMYAVYVVAADVNNDGNMDLISANWNPSGKGTLTVLTNNGDGVFGSNATLNVDTEPICVAAADINGDGNPDLISLSLNAGTLTVLTNNGSGGFGLNATIPLVSTVNYWVVAADVNDDSKPDLIIANTGGSGSGHTLTILTNNGSGVFRFNATLTTGYGPGSVAAADVNGDGKLDLISANCIANTLTVLTNNGSGVFGSNATLNVGNGPHSVVAADIDGDGKLDLISANENASTLTVLTNNGSGGFGPNTTLNVGIYPFCVVAADVNGDGKPDLVSANMVANTLTVFINIPMLAINRSGDNALVSWPSFWTGWTLQQNLDLTTTNWAGCTGIADDGTNRSLTIPSPTGNRFFRLSYP
jgi:hypothetical protein